MERRVLLAIFLAFVVLYGYQMLLVPPPPNEATETPPAASPRVAAPTAPPVVVPERPPDAGATLDTGTPAPAPAPLIGEENDREIRVETENVVAVFTNRGARLRSWRLKNHVDASGEPHEFVPQDVQGQPLPFSLRVEDPAVTDRLNSALYRVTSAPADRGVLTAPTEIAFEYEDAMGLHARKSFRVDSASYVIDFESTVTQGDTPLDAAVEWGPAIAGSGGSSRWSRMAGGVLYAGEIERLAAGDIASQPARQGDFRYVGVEDHYFLTVAVHPGPSTVTFQAVALPPLVDSQETAQNLVSYTIDTEAPGSTLSVFAGPKDFDRLAAVDAELVRAIDFGMFAFLVVPLLRALSGVNGYVGNYGWSIIILTVIINAVMFPLRHKSVVSMRKMQEIQPEAKAIQERYKNLKATDPAKQKMNQELMALYRERGVNPASGCVPMLLTFPVLLAFYSLLTVSIELRGAPFFGWIQDLSQPDPFYIIPVLMGATQFWQMRLTPQAGVDPAQQKLMQFMPLLFMVFFLWAPAGVVLYWFASNLWAIGQQYATNYIIGPPQVRPVRPPAERKVKRVGAGRSSGAAASEK